jgi:hypothetical protein
VALELERLLPEGAFAQLPRGVAASAQAHSGGANQKSFSPGKRRGPDMR